MLKVNGRREETAESRTSLEPRQIFLLQAELADKYQFDDEQTKKHTAPLVPDQKVK